MIDLHEGILLLFYEASLKGREKFEGTKFRTFHPWAETACLECGLPAHQHEIYGCRPQLPAVPTTPRTRGLDSHERRKMRYGQQSKNVRRQTVAVA